MKLAGKYISELSLDQLQAVLSSMKGADAKRQKASTHKKFDKANNPKALIFPAANPAFKKLVIAIQEEIGKRK